MKVTIICQCATNKGDRAIAEFLIEKIKRKYGQNVDIVLSSSNKKMWNNIDGIRTINTGFPNFINKDKNKLFYYIYRIFYKIFLHILFPSVLRQKKSFIQKMFSRKFIKEISSSDLVIITGGHHITSIREKNCLFDVTYDISLSYLYAKKYVLWSQTIGPLVFNDKAKKLFESIFNHADRIFIRDETSIETLNKIYPNNNFKISKTEDTVFGYQSMISLLKGREREKKVGVAVFDGSKLGIENSQYILKMLEIFVKNGYAVEFFKMEYHNMETEIINEIINQLPKDSNTKVFEFSHTSLEHINEVSTCQYFIGYKTHSIIMALTTNTPLIAIAYHKKTFDFMKKFGLEHFCVFDNQLNNVDFEGAVQELIDSHDVIEEKEEKVSRQLSLKINTDFDDYLDNVKND